ncbi:MAG: hypothetical protein R3E32_16150 [Chitinophagales bacterium]
MNASTQEIIAKFNQLPQNLQQQVIDYIDFLIWKYKIEIPAIPQESEVMDETISIEESEVQKTPTIVEKNLASVEPENTSTSTEQITKETQILVENPTPVEPENTEPNAVKIIKEKSPSPEELQMDQQLEAIKKANKDKIAPNWQEIKKTFLDEFY